MSSPTFPPRHVTPRGPTLSIRRILVYGVAGIAIFAASVLRPAHAIAQPLPFAVLFAAAAVALAATASWSANSRTAEKRAVGTLALAASGPLTAIYALLSIPSAIYFSRLSDRWQRRKPLVNAFMPLAGSAAGWSGHRSGATRSPCTCSRS